MFICKAQEGFGKSGADLMSGVRKPLNFKLEALYLWKEEALMNLEKGVGSCLSPHDTYVFALLLSSI